MEMLPNDRKQARCGVSIGTARGCSRAEASRSECVFVDILLGALLENTESQIDEAESQTGPGMGKASVALRPQSGASCHIAPGLEGSNQRTAFCPLRPRARLGESVGGPGSDEGQTTPAGDGLEKTIVSLQHSRMSQCVVLLAGMFAGTLASTFAVGHLSSYDLNNFLGCVQTLRKGLACDSIYVNVCIYIQIKACQMLTHRQTQSITRTRQPVQVLGKVVLVLGVRELRVVACRATASFIACCSRNRGRLG